MYSWVQIKQINKINCAILKLPYMNLFTTVSYCFIVNWVDEGYFDAVKVFEFLIFSSFIFNVFLKKDYG